MPTTACSEVVTLNGGLRVTLDALRIGWDLENRGFRLTPEGTRLRVEPHGLLTPGDRVAIRTYRDELLMLATYEAPLMEQ
jgi:hypothetical protein